MTRRLAEVAKYVGVSEATVSRVLNGKPGISEATRTAVLTALDVLGYERPTKLRGERARLVGLVLPELQNPIFPAFAEVVAGALAKRGFTPVLCTRTADGVSEADYVDMLLDQHVSGVIFAGGLYAQADADHEHYHRLHERGLPVVLVNAAIDDLGFPRGLGRRRVTRSDQAYRHLTSLGHERIGLLLGPVRPRAVGPQARRVPGGGAVGVHGQTGDVERTIFSMEGGQAAAIRLIRQGVTGDHLRQRRARARCHPGGPPARSRGARRHLGGRLRRLGLHELHRPAADHGPPADRGDGAGRGRAAGQPGGGQRRCRPRRCSSSRSWSSAARPAPCGQRPRKRPDLPHTRRSNFPRGRSDLACGLPESCGPSMQVAPDDPGGRAAATNLRWIIKILQRTIAFFER